MTRIQGGETKRKSPAQSLAGIKLPDGWIVEKLVKRPANATGGHFSTSYIVCSKEGNKAFLKAMDFQTALSSPDPALATQEMTAAFLFERNLLKKCESNNLSRIVRVLSDGKLAATADDPSTVVQYLIFELADGDIRSAMKFSEQIDNAWTLRTIHQIAAALRQLHSVQIAHQDLKPSNVLAFGSKDFKLADLGRAFDRSSNSPHDEFHCAGDKTYAPPELLYGYINPDWRVRRLACDLYLLGSFVFFLHTKVSLTHELLGRLDEQHHYKFWGRDYAEVLPYLQQALTQIIREFGQSVQSNCNGELTETIRQLCNLDPKDRGHPRNRKYNGSQYSLERYVSLFDRLARRAEWAVKSGK